MNNHNSKHGRATAAVIFICFGFLLLLSNLEIVEFGYVISTFWPSIIIAWALYRLLIRKDNNLVWLISVLVVMVLIQISRLELLEYHLLAYWPVIIVLIGVNILLKPKRVTVEEVEADNVSRTIENTFDLHVVFNSVEKIVQSTQFVGGSVNTVFGATKIDLVGATPSSGDMVLKLSVVFGEIVIRVPTGWNVSLNVTPVFGAAEDIRSPFIATYQANAPMLHISGSAVLGAVKLKN